MSLPHMPLHLREHELDAAFLTPIDYARESSALPDRARRRRSIRSEATGTITSSFASLHTVSTVAIDPASASEIVLARYPRRRI